MTDQNERWALADLPRLSNRLGNGLAEDWCDECGAPGPHALRSGELTFCCERHRALYLERLARHEQRPARTDAPVTRAEAGARVGALARDRAER